mmetsp:Transcript_1465/g.2692  ORF Transcript_1465/g.2692 Transcript_1465/m.2692 type:complete len:87 (-) Transcript_1465:112-372(-)
MSATDCAKHQSVLYSEEFIQTPFVDGMTCSSDPLVFLSPLVVVLLLCCCCKLGCVVVERLLLVLLLIVDNRSRGTPAVGDQMCGYQ